MRSAWQRWGWSSFLRDAVERYGPEGSFWEENPELPFMPIRRWEIWNEENIVTFSEPARSGRLRDPDPNLRPGPAPRRPRLEGDRRRPLRAAAADPAQRRLGRLPLALYRARNVKRYFDGVALHPYVADARAMGAQLDNLRRILRVHHDTATPLYVTELGWGSRSGPTRWERGLYGQANQLSKAFAMLSEHRLRWRIGGVWWFTWTDEGGTCQFCSSAGLLTASREAKPAWYQFNAWTGGDPDTVRQRAERRSEADA